MKTLKLGQDGPQVSALGLGCMSLGIAEVYTSSIRSDADAIALIHHALDHGMTMLDTANIYGDSEAKVGQAIRGRRDDVVLASKFGIVVEAIGASATESANGRPEYVRSCCEASLKALGVDHLDLYYQHRIDPTVPIEDTVGAMAELVRQGKVRHLGLSEAAPATIRRAHAVYPIAAVQTEYSLWSREPEDALLPTLRELGIGLVAYSPLGRGVLAGRFKSLDDMTADDWRRGSPRFQGDNFAKNLALVDKIRALTADKGCTPSQLALAWLLAQGEALRVPVVPIPGTTRTARLDENVGAAAITLSAEEMKSIDAIAPKGVAAGARYAEAATALLDH